MPYLLLLLWSIAGIVWVLSSAKALEDTRGRWWQKRWASVILAGPVWWVLEAVWAYLDRPRDGRD